MSPRPPKVQLLGLLPAILKPCGPACAQPFTNVSVEALIDEERREPQDFTDQGNDRRKGRHWAEDREGQNDGQAEVLERREGREGDLFVSREPEGPPEEEREGPDPKCPGERKQTEGDEQLGSLE